MGIEDIVGRSYGPRPYRTDRSVVDGYRTAIGLEAGGPAPPALAGAMLFVVAPDLLHDPDIGGYGTSVIHGEQTFTWHRPIPLDRTLAVSGVLSKCRMRGGVAFAGFDVEVADEDGPVVTGGSLFLMSDASATGTDAGEDQEPVPDEGSIAEVGARGDTGDRSLPSNRFSASRADLVRYAGASGDWNPIHWDHATAVDAGLSGVVVHGLLQSAWMLTVGEAVLGAPTWARFRYRAPLRPASVVTVVGGGGNGTVDLRLEGDDTVHVAATVRA